jgi:SAM-dependent methyltransferase
MDRFANPAGKGRLMAEETSHYAVVAVDDEGRQLARLLDGYIAPQVARVMALLGVPDQMGETERTAEELASATGAAPGPLARLLAAASLYGLVTQAGGGKFALTPMGARLRTDIPGSMRSMAIGFLAPPLWQAWGQLAEVVQTGRPSDPASWEYFQQHPGEAAWFGRAMSQLTAAVVSRLAATGYAPPAAGRIVDVGGGRGTLLASLLRGAPHARGVVFDRAEALSDTPAVLAGAGLTDRTEIISGDFFAEVPEGDLHVLSNVLHDWEDDEARRIIANCHRAGRPGGGLLVVGYLMPTPPEPSLAYLMDLLMMMVMGGRERSLAELRSLMAAEGYGFARDVPLGDSPVWQPWHVVEFLRQ